MIQSVTALHSIKKATKPAAFLFKKIKNDFITFEIEKKKKNVYMNLNDFSFETRVFLI